MSLSFGVVIVEPTAENNIEALLTQADQLMYEQKQKKKMFGCSGEMKRLVAQSNCELRIMT